MDKTVTNPNDFKVLELFNSTDFDFTPELGAMYDGRPLFVKSGERKQFPYHVGYRLAVNLAKVVLIKGAPVSDPDKVDPVGKPLWGEEGVQKLADSFITELYMDEKPVVESETDKLMAKVDALEKLFKEKNETNPIEEGKVVSLGEYLDKQEVIAELEKRGIKHDKRSTKETLEKLLA